MNNSTLRANFDALLDLLVLAAVAFGNLLLIARSSATVPALVLIAAGLVVLIARRNVRLLQVPLLLPLAAFLFTGWLSIGASYDPDASWKKFWLLIAGVGLYLAIAALETEWTRVLVVWGLLLVCGGTALFFVTQQDFAHDPAKLGMVNQIGMALHRISPQFGFHIPHPNLIAGILLLGLPFGIGGAWDAFHKRKWVTAIPFLLITLWIVFGIGMTTSRGAVLAFGVVVVLGAAIWLALRFAKGAGLSATTALAILLNAGLVIVILFFLVGGPAAPALINKVLGSTNGVPRTEIFRQAFHLGQDTPFTGIGLDTFALNYASYELLIDVLFLPHAHNLYLQIWIEQGLLGIAAFAWWLIAFYAWAWHRRARMNWLALAGVVAVSLMLVHGLVDVLIYFSRVLPLMFIPFGLAVSALNEGPAPQPVTLSTRGRILLAAAVGVALVFIGLVLFTRRTELLAQWEANQGANKQAQIELPNYHFPDHILRIVRQSADETPALDLFQQALVRDPNNRTANLRMGLIELDQQKFDEAAQHLETAYRADPTNRASTKALGYAYVWTGKLDQAVKLLRDIDEAPTELQTAAGVWQHSNKPQLAQNANMVIQKLKTQAQ